MKGLALGLALKQRQRELGNGLVFLSKAITAITKAHIYKELQRNCTALFHCCRAKLVIGNSYEIT